jgi:hypothetical protein
MAKQQHEYKEKTWTTKTVPLAVSFYPRDVEMVEELVEHFGSNKSDVLRTSIRTLYVKVLGKNA